MEFTEWRLTLQAIDAYNLLQIGEVRDIGNHSRRLAEPYE